ncbi:MAG: hypothetical protein AVDCRST_MAG17-1371, partial [uncultured Solirubrobacterales bacterium]
GLVVRRRGRARGAALTRIGLCRLGAQRSPPPPKPEARRAGEGEAPYRDTPGHGAGHRFGAVSADLEGRRGDRCAGGDVAPTSRGHVRPGRGGCGPARGRGRCRIERADLLVQAQELARTDSL